MERGSQARGRWRGPYVWADVKTKQGRNRGLSNEVSDKGAFDDMQPWKRAVLLCMWYSDALGLGLVGF